MRFDLGLSKRLHALTILWLAVWNSLLDYANNPDNLPTPAVAMATQGGLATQLYYNRNIYV
jgi:hypothetical protein